MTHQRSEALWALILIAALAASACAVPVKAKPARVYAEDVAPAEVEVKAPDPIPTNDNLNSTLWMQTASEYRTLSVQSYRLAASQLDIALKDRKWTAAIEQTEKFANLPAAVILDIDETVLDNSAYQARLVKDGASYDPKTWAAWSAERKASAIPGALEFCKLAVSKDVTVFYLTNRVAAEEEDTRANLIALGFPVDEKVDTLLMKEEQEGWGSDKGTRRSVVAAQYRVLMLVGDNLGDFFDGAKASVAVREALEAQHADKWGTKWIVLPNPAYGSWEGAIYDNQKDIDARAKAAAKFGALRDAR